MDLNFICREAILVVHVGMDMSEILTVNVFASSFVLVIPRQILAAEERNVYQPRKVQLLSAG